MKVAGSLADDASHGPRPVGARRSLLLAIGSTILSVLPVFLVGALATLIRSDLQFSQAQLGAVASAFYGTSAVASIPGGRLAQRLGPEQAMAFGAMISAACLIGIAMFATDAATLFGLLLFGGLGNALAQPAANSAVARDQPQDRQGMAFGVLQTALPMSTLIAGMSVPTVGLQLGWRWAFVIVASGAVPIAAYGLRRHAAAGFQRRAGHATGRGVRKMPLYLLATAGAFAAAPPAAMGAFYVESAVASGISPGAAGIWLVGGSVCGVSGRLLWGLVADRWSGDPLDLMAGVMAFGGAGFVVLGASTLRPLLLVGTVVAFGAGWSWKTLYNLTVVRQYPQWTSGAVGITQAGAFAGSMVGPLAFGLAVEQWSYGLAWTASAAFLVVAALLVRVERRLL